MVTYPIYPARNAPEQLRCLTPPGAATGHEECAISGADGYRGRPLLFWRLSKAGRVANWRPLKNGIKEAALLSSAALGHNVNCGLISW